MKKFWKFVWCILVHRKLEPTFHRRVIGYTESGYERVIEYTTWHCPECDALDSLKGQP